MATEMVTWDGVSFWAFLVRHRRQAFAAGPSAWSKELKAKAQPFFRLGVELDVLELDLSLTIHEFRTAYEALYSAPEHLARKKFAVVYHIDNFYVRVHKFLENLHGILALSVGLDIESKPKPGSPSRRASLKNALGVQRLAAIDSRVRRFEEESAIQQSREARNLFVHRYRDEPKWPALGPASRLIEFEDTNESDRLIRQELEPSEIDRYADGKATEFHSILKLVGSLRSDLYRQYLQELVAFLAREPSEIRNQWQWLVDWQEMVLNVKSG